jgi:hypothetical protein
MIIYRLDYKINDTNFTQTIYILNAYSGRIRATLSIMYFNQSCMHESWG